MAPKFLCCLPLRLGVLVISFIQFMICGAVAGLMWFLVHFIVTKDSQVDLPADSPLKFQDQDVKKVLIAAIVIGAVYTFSTLIGFLGFLGAIFKKVGFVKAFSFLLFLVFVIQLASSVLGIVLYYWVQHHSFQRCVQGASDDFSKQFCDFTSKFMHDSPAIIWVSSIVPLLIQAYACYVVSQYSKRLQRQKLDKSRSSAVYQPVGTPAPNTHETIPLTYPVNNYPYSDAAHSFGHQPQPIRGDINISNKV